MKVLVQSAMIFLCFFIIDRIYLTVMGQRIQLQVLTVQHSPLHKKQLATLLLNLVALVAIVFLIVLPRARLIDAFCLGAIIHGTVNFTNMALFDNWDKTLTLIDILFGGVQMASATYLGRILASKI